ncbi:MAG: phosphoenolpyruvate--protein phosphotransferase [Deltaproteobacteria bacterium]|nr:MAG: phosphoenolpyruvate--protein phosphotransferase [Deltaproteobacteria bacterium]
MVRQRTRRFKGIAASPGIAIGTAHLVDRRQFKIPKMHISPDQVEGEIARFRRAIRNSVAQLEAIKQTMSRADRPEPLAIIDAQILMIQDKMLVEGTEAGIAKKLQNAEWALRDTVMGIRREFDRLEDDYFRERRSDVEFVGQRIMRNLMGEDTEIRLPASERAIVVAHDLSPVDTANLDKASVGGFVTEAGGKTSHTAIIARSLVLPAVVGAEGVLAAVGQGDLVVVDGYRGEVVVNPSQRYLKEVEARRDMLQNKSRKLSQQRALPAVTLDGFRVRLLANLEMVEEVEPALSNGAEGVGLFRTEFLFLHRRAPSEGYQRKCYREILRRMDGRPVTIRTLDLGGDKRLPFLKAEPENNPALGLRSIRMSLRNRSLFLAQLRALLRASVDGNLHLLFPMISCMHELKQAKEALEEAKRQLKEKGQPFNPDIKVGIMIEVPSAAIMADVMAREVDFFSIGTNDLVQYMLAADRQNEQVAYLFNPLHVSILRTLEHVVKSAHERGIPVTLCGEMAGDPFYLPVLIGLEIDQVSMNHLALPYARYVIRQLKRSEARRLVKHLMEFDDSRKIEAYLRGWMSSKFPDLFTPEGPAEILGGL